MNPNDIPPNWRLEHYESLESTNDLAKTRARAGEAGQVAILADEQTAGRGRMGRAWVAPSGAGLLVSLLLRFGEGQGRAEVRDPGDPVDLAAVVGASGLGYPSILRAEQAYVLTMLAGVALCEAVEEVASVKAMLKWPNDLMLQGGDGKVRKAGGILAEVDIRNGRVAWVVLGMGVNLNWQPIGITDGRELHETATSIATVAGGSIDRMAFLAAVLRRIDYHLVRMESQAELLHANWRNRLVTLGQQVTIRLPDQVIQGLAEDVTSSGGLYIRKANGSVQVVTAGDVEA
jgi:BirA family transcriptional regulator, biotin operon repressor / biotin---[acetyl-CoA-carboxylase] ligase